MESTIFITPSDILEANRRFDQQYPEFLHAAPMRSARSMSGNKVGDVLTDAKIAKYERAGYYRADFQQARKELWQKKQRKREGNFMLVGDRLVYQPQ